MKIEKVVLVITLLFIAVFIFKYIGGFNLYEEPSISSERLDVEEDISPLENKTQDNLVIQIANETVNESDESTQPEVLWKATHETKDLSEWKWYKNSKPSQDSGFCNRPFNGVTKEKAHLGEYSMKMSIQSWFPKSGCRQFRTLESKTEDSLYYSAWLYFPYKYQVNGWTNVMQFKSRKNDNAEASKVFWSVRMQNREDGNMFFELSWKGGEGEVFGPFETDKNNEAKQYSQDRKDVIERTWTHLEIYLKQSDQYKGQLIVWQDGIELFNVNNVKTKYENGFNSWSVNSYGANISPNPFTIYVDDAVISKQRIGNLNQIFTPSL